jgi:hypothetical protein
MAEQNRFLQWIRNQIPDSAQDWQRVGVGALGSMFGGPALGFALSRGFDGFGGFNPFQNLGTGARGIGTSFGRMFDGNAQTGFFNNPTAPWNWGNGPANVSQGHPDFMGPVQYGPPQSQTYTPGNPSQWGPPNPNQEYLPGDPREWGPPAPSKPRTGGSAGNRGNSSGAFSNFGGRGPVASGLGWRSYGGTGGPLGGSDEGGMSLGGIPSGWAVFDR